MSDWAAVARAVNERMRELDITQRELAERSGISPATLREIQQGANRQRSRSTLAAISRALRWPEDHLRRVSTEGQVSESTAEDAPALASLREELTELRQRVEALESRLQQ
ncbi:Helix-turn-helix domain-containing protein [Thermomonospora echinospora]|uniref:Helix-turn-helix domain-containing protein n=1 Tax=Thermomonospora echinospora TaxID=1992 RepID=A0A1H6DY31_9ACTN|nr:helix-turn-helix transcriptional regulator [Thermomonospora echinospora]SEG90218.1 Helix-turn-helix domain-containing protein [Thermomonospora echinospora]